MNKEKIGMKILKIRDEVIENTTIRDDANINKVPLLLLSGKFDEAINIVFSKKSHEGGLTTDAELRMCCLYDYKKTTSMFFDKLDQIDKEREYDNFWEVGDTFWKSMILGLILATKDLYEYHDADEIFSATGFKPTDFIDKMVLLVDKLKFSNELIKERFIGDKAWTSLIDEAMSGMVKSLTNANVVAISKKLTTIRKNEFKDMLMNSFASKYFHSLVPAGKNDMVRCYNELILEIGSRQK